MIVIFWGIWQLQHYDLYNVCWMDILHFSYIPQFRASRIVRTFSQPFCPLHIFIVTLPIKLYLGVEKIHKKKIKKKLRICFKEPVVRLLV